MEIANSGNQKYFPKGIQALEILASVVSALEEKNPLSKAGLLPQASVPLAALAPPDHRVSCHRCGNIRKKKLVCVKSSCPHIFCGRCSDKMKEEHGREVFIGGCPVCKELCCCTNKTVYCNRINHCYRKCPATKTSRTPSSKRERDSAEDFPEQNVDTDERPEMNEQNTGMILGRKRTAMNTSPTGYADDLLNSIYVSSVPESSVMSPYRAGVSDMTHLKMPTLLTGDAGTLLSAGVGPSLIGNQVHNLPFAVLPQTCVFLWSNERGNSVPITPSIPFTSSSATDLTSMDVNTPTEPTLSMPSKSTSDPCTDTLKVERPYII